MQVDALWRMVNKLAFEEKLYPDGESTFAPPKWRKTIEQIHQNIDGYSFEEETTRRRTISEDEIVMKHEKNGSYIRIKDDGAIEAFTGYGTGFRIGNNESFQLFSDRIQLIGRETQVSSSPNGFEKSYPVIEKKGLTESFKTLAEEERS